MKERMIMKKHIKMLVAALLLCFALVPAAKAEAAVATPAAPGGLGLYASKGNEFMLSWNLDQSLAYNTYSYYGYEVVIENLKGKKILTLDSDTYTDFGTVTNNPNKVAVIANSSKLKTQGFRFKVRAFVYDEIGTKVYGKYSGYKVIIPRANITGGKMSGSNVKISWQKVTGAKNYSVYLSSNNGKSFKKVATTSKKSATLKKLKKYKDYYVYVQANKVTYKKKKYNSTKPTDKVTGAYSFYIYTSYR